MLFAVQTFKKGLNAYCCVVNPPHWMGFSCNDYSVFSRTLFPIHSAYFSLAVNEGQKPTVLYESTVLVHVVGFCWGASSPQTPKIEPCQVSLNMP